MIELKNRKKSIVRNVRISENLDTTLRAIAVYEEKSISEVIQDFLMQTAKNYLEFASVDFVHFFNKLDIEDQTKIIKLLPNDIQNIYFSFADKDTD